MDTNSSKTSRMDQEDACRRNVRTLLSAIVNDDAHITVDQLEKSVFNKTVVDCGKNDEHCSWKCDAFRERYAHAARTVINALKNGAEAKDRFAFLSPQEMCPGAWQDVVKRLEMRQRHRMELSGRMAPMTQLYTCAKCKGKECVFQEKFSRSADEPAVIHVKCIGCGHSWRM